jgi:CoA:oxalate CoA-transferase
VVLDLKQDRDRSAALRLAARADVVVHNYRPGVMERLGLGYDVCRVTNQGLVYCAISGYGQHGPSATAPAFAQIIHAASGHDAVHMSYQADASRPPVTGVYFADILGGLTAFSSITTALLQRTTTGRGDFIDVSLMDAMVSAMPFEVQASQHALRSATAPHPPLRAKDGFVIAIPMTDRNFRDLAAVIDRPDLVDDPRFSTQAERDQHWAELYEVVEAWTRQYDSAVVEDRMRSQGVPASQYRTLDEVLSDRDASGLHFLRPAEDGAGRYLVAGLPFQLGLPTHHDADGTLPLIEELGASTRNVIGGLDVG